jgi:peptidoglycan hydrolase CwlO-like protein
MDEDDMIALKSRCILLAEFLKSISSSNFECPFEESTDLEFEYRELVETYTDMQSDGRKQFLTNLQDDLHSLQSPVECSSVNLDDVRRQIEEFSEVESQLKAQIGEIEVKILEARSSSGGK